MPKLDLTGWLRPRRDRVADSATVPAALATRVHQAKPKGAPNALMASAARIDLRSRPHGDAVQQSWQAEAWRYYDICGELRAAANWMGNSLARAVLYPAEVGADGKPTSKPTEDPTALAAAQDLLGGPSSQSGVLQQIGVHLVIAGDCYVVGETPTDEYGNPAGDDEWTVASTDELFYRAGQWEIDRGDGRRVLDPDATVIIRVWQSHPRKKWLADSATRAALPVLRELEQLVKTAGQQMDSRLAGAGILILPSEVSFPDASPEQQEANPDADPLTLALAESIYTPLDNPEDPSRLVPFVLRVPNDYVSAVQHISLADSITAENMDAREQCIRRLALALDLPPEVLLGQADSNHWSAWQIAEDAIRVHIDPKLTIIVEAFTEGYYEPALEALGLDPHGWTLWFDTSELVQRPNRTADAALLYDKGELSGAALRREAGFVEDDAPSPEERIGRLLLAVAPAHPELIGQMLPHLGITWLEAGLGAISPPSPVDGDTTVAEAVGPPAVPAQGQTPELTAP